MLVLRDRVPVVGPFVTACCVRTLHAQPDAEEDHGENGENCSEKQTRNPGFHVVLRGAVFPGSATWRAWTQTRPVHRDDVETGRITTTRVPPASPWRSVISPPCSTMISLARANPCRLPTGRVEKNGRRHRVGVHGDARSHILDGYVRLAPARDAFTRCLP